MRTFLLFMFFFYFVKVWLALLVCACSSYKDCAMLGGLSHQSGKVAGMTAPLKSNSSGTPVKQLSHIRSNSVRDLKTCTLCKTMSFH